MGNLTQRNFTSIVDDLDYQYPPTGGRGTRGVEYRITYNYATTIEGEPAEDTDFIPIAALERSDGDLVLVYLSGNGVHFAQPIDDDWYRATVPYAAIGSAVTSGKTQAYRMQDAASPMGCVERWQWCNLAVPQDHQCGPLASFADAIFGAAPLFNVTKDILLQDRPYTPEAMGSQFLWYATSLGTFLIDILQQLGAKSLGSQDRLYNGVQWPLPSDQWKLDVQYWWNVILALNQDSFVRLAQGPSGPEFNSLRWPPRDKEEEKFCDSQKVRSTAHTSFSLFGILFTAVTGFLLICASYALEPVLTCLHKRYKYKQYARLEWVSNSSLQLHRLTHEEPGLWFCCTGEIPTTKHNVLLANLDITDLEHPVLQPSPDGTLSEKPESEPGEAACEDTAEHTPESSTADLTVISPTSDPISDSLSEAEPVPTPLLKGSSPERVNETE